MKTILKIALGIILAFVLLIGGCAVLIGGAANEVSKDIEEAENTVHTVTYKVTGTGKADLTFSTDTAQTAQENGQSLPWEKTVEIKGDLFEVYTVLAQHSAGGGDITCEIVVDGKSVSTNTSKGEYTIADCTHTLS